MTFKKIFDVFFAYIKIDEKLPTGLVTKDFLCNKA